MAVEIKSRSGVFVMRDGTEADDPVYRVTPDRWTRFERTPEGCGLADTNAELFVREPRKGKAPYQKPVPKPKQQAAEPPPNAPKATGPATLASTRKDPDEDSA